MQYVFVYGTLKQGQPNHHLLEGHVTFIGQGQTEVKYPLVQAGSFNVPYLLELPGQGELVEGEIYCVNDAMLERMDQLEGHPNYYERTKVKIRLSHAVEEGQPTDQSHTESALCQGQTLVHGGGQDRERFECWTYFLRDYRPELEQLPALRVFDAYTGERRFCMPREAHGKQRKEVMLKPTSSTSSQ